MGHWHNSNREESLTVDRTCKHSQIDYEELVKKGTNQLSQVLHLRIGTNLYRKPHKGDDNGLFATLRKDHNIENRWPCEKETSERSDEFHTVHSKT